MKVIASLTPFDFVESIIAMGWSKESSARARLEALKLPGLPATGCRPDSSVAQIQADGVVDPGHHLRR